MLDDLPLSAKLEIARTWFEEAQAGKFDLTGRQAQKFSELLECCQTQAANVETALLPHLFQQAEPEPVAGAEPQVGDPAPAGGNILAFMRGMAMPKVVRS
jgi:hypothetical protein